MARFKDLNKQDKGTLLKLPVYISLLASSNDFKMDDKEKKEAIELSHIRSFSYNPLLRDYFSEVEKHFEENLTDIEKELPQEKKERQQAIKEGIVRAEELLKKMGRLHDETVRQAMNAYIDHVSKAHDNVLGRFFFPLSIKGIAD